MPNFCADNCHGLGKVVATSLDPIKTLGFAVLGLRRGQIRFGYFSIILRALVSAALSLFTKMFIILGVTFALDCYLLHQSVSNVSTFCFDRQIWIGFVISTINKCLGGFAYGRLSKFNLACPEHSIFCLYFFTITTSSCESCKMKDFHSFYLLIYWYQQVVFTLLKEDNSKY